MDLRFAPEQDEFRADIRRFLQASLPAEAEAIAEGYHWGFSPTFTRKLGERGWLALTWPEKYGGSNRGFLDQAILNEELGYARAPTAFHRTGVFYVAPVLLIYGSEAQKSFFLPAIARGEAPFCQGFSEPNSGSDLASLRTRAVRDGDDWIVNGQKIWTTEAHHAEYCWLTARTNPDAPKHRGISCFIVDMKSPGVTVRPVISLTGDHLLNEVFFESVRVPGDRLIGEADRGWYQMAVMLDYERSAIGVFGALRRTLDELIETLRTTQRDGRPVAEDPIARQKVAQIAVEIEVGRLLAYHVAAIQDRGIVPNREGSIVKLYRSELAIRVTETATELLGLRGFLRPGSRRAPNEGRFGHYRWLATAAPIGGGTSEIQRSVIATRGLGLPR